MNLSPCRKLRLVPQKECDFKESYDFNRDVIDALRDALQWTGFEKLLLPMLGRIVRHGAELKEQLIEFILSSDRIPESILRRVAKLSLSTSRDVAVLSLMSQKHPKILQDAKRELVIEDEASLQDLDDLLLELTIVRL